VLVVIFLVVSLIRQFDPFLYLEFTVRRSKSVFIFGFHDCSIVYSFAEILVCSWESSRVSVVSGFSFIVQVCEEFCFRYAEKR